MYWQTLSLLLDTYTRHLCFLQPSSPLVILLSHTHRSRSWFSSVRAITLSASCSLRVLFIIWALFFFTNMLTVILVCQQLDMFKLYYQIIFTTIDGFFCINLLTILLHIPPSLSHYWDNNVNKHNYYDILPLYPWYLRHSITITWFYIPFTLK